MDLISHEGRDGAKLVQEIYRMLRRRARANHQTPSKELPADGLYFFFERGESVEIGGDTQDRVTRIGINDRDGNFRSRIRQHYGRAHSLSGNKNGSVFRKHVGGAIMNRADPNDPRLPEWLAQGGASYLEIEQAVSRYLREYCTFCFLGIPERNRRLRAEEGLIALFARYPLARPSAGWLGRFASNPAIPRTGLWNSRHVDASPLDWDESALLSWI